LNKIRWLKRMFENDTELRDSTKYRENLGRLNSYQLLRKAVVDEASLDTHRSIQYFLNSYQLLRKAVVDEASLVTYKSIRYFLNSYQLLRKAVVDEASLVTYRSIRFFLNSYQLLRKAVVDEASLVTHRSIRYFLPSRWGTTASRENKLVHHQVTPPSSKFQLFFINDIC